MNVLILGCLLSAALLRVHGEAWAFSKTCLDCGNGLPSRLAHAVTNPQCKWRCCPAGDLASDLTSFAKAFTGGLGQNSSDWSLDGGLPACSWSGVACDLDNGTFSIDIRQQSLKGVGWLEAHLRTLDSNKKLMTVGLAV